MIFINIIPCHPQAFNIPVIQIVHETLTDQQEGKKGRASIKTGGTSENTLPLFITFLIIRYIKAHITIHQICYIVERSVSPLHIPQPVSTM